MINPLVSVIIPVYNGEKYIAECIEQMLSQSYKNLEIIVVNDGSTDNSLMIAKKFPVKIVDNKRNRGLAYSRNIGIESAQGEYIHFMDVDDAINSDYYLNMVKALKNTEADMICGGIVNERKPHRTMMIAEQKELFSTNEKLRATNVGRWGYAVRYLYKKSFLVERELQFEEGRFIEDLPFSLAAVYFARSLVMAPGTAYTYIYREGSIMTRRDKAHRRKRHQDMRHMKTVRHRFARKHGFKIPGVPTKGWWSLFFVKWFT